ncbi:OsmC family protein [Mycoplasmoides genitalium]|uniref:Organic hydroperoxide resistance protein-like n=2 Tax=Mycoplasmoides genitalium TaxID=2097 RepID=OHRL_MYCGE|nr:OsmC family protein [Mycoplasmoides genitalium]P47692.2 RecName: Full=Organic hydroperoxide resistance protein-like [Mycoplasmoides genitalium G37]
MALIYKTVAQTETGREGSVKTLDGFQTKLSFPKPDLSVQTENNPEQLFASAYASCFSQAVIVVMQQHQFSFSKKPVVSVKVELHQENGLFHIKAGVELTTNSNDQEVGKKLIQKAHEMCPFSRLIRNENFLGLTLNGIKL